MRVDFDSKDIFIRDISKLYGGATSEIYFSSHMHMLSLLKNIFSNIKNPDKKFARKYPHSMFAR
jgi:hypothetical protein